MTRLTRAAIVGLVVAVLAAALAVSLSVARDQGAVPAPPTVASPETSMRAATVDPADRPVVVVLGASIALGYRTTAALPWPRQLDALLAARAGAPRIVDASISATRLLTDTDAGPSYRSRLAGALDVPGVRSVLITDLINDIQAAPHVYDPVRIEDGIRDIADRAHARGVSVIATTIAPYGGYHFTDDYTFSSDGETCRQAVNATLRRGGIVDQVIDVDRVLADPSDPSRLDPRLDSGDHLHPNDAGHRVMAGQAADVLGSK